MIIQLRRFTAFLLVFCMASAGVQLPAQAAVIATDGALGNVERERIASLLDRVEVRNRLEAYGVSPAEVKARVAALSDEEVAQLARRIDSLPAGGDGIIGAIVLVFIVLLITDILGFTKIFPFTRPIR